MHNLKYLVVPLALTTMTAAIPAIAMSNRTTTTPHVEITEYAPDTTIPAPNPTITEHVNASEFRIVVIPSDHIIRPSHRLYLAKHLRSLFNDNAPSTLETVTTIAKGTPEETFSVLPSGSIDPQTVSTSTASYTGFASSATVPAAAPTVPIALIPAINGLLLPAQGPPLRPRGEAMDLQAQAWAATQAAASGQVADANFWKAFKCYAMLALFPRPFQFIPMLTPWCRHALSHENKYAENSAIHNNGMVVVTKTVNTEHSMTLTPIIAPIATDVSVPNTIVSFPNTTVKSPNTTVVFSTLTNVTAGHRPLESIRTNSISISDPHFTYTNLGFTPESVAPSSCTSTTASPSELSTLLLPVFPSSSASLVPRFPLLHKCPEGPYCHVPWKHPFKWVGDQFAKWSKTEWGKDNRISIGDDAKAVEVKPYETNKRPKKPKGYKGGKKHGQEDE